MEILICIDDTDDLTKATSTGKIADAIEKKLLKNGVASESFGITRHQLLLDDRIKYTSHNSSMCLRAVRNENIYDLTEAAIKEIEKEITKICVDVILELKSAESDPGLCVFFPEKLPNKEKLISFGLSGQNIILTKDMAYGFAEKEGIHLSEHGGDGSGVIGAICGAGLRLSGFDGWFRGKIELAEAGIKGRTVSARELTEKTGIPVLCDGMCLKSDEEVEVEEKIKCLLMNHQKVIAVQKKQGKNTFALYNKKTMKNAAILQADVCGAFEYDSDEEERMAATPNEKSCFNCLYRRWTQQGFECAAK